MRVVLRPWLLVLLAGCAVAPRIALERADARARNADLHGALALYDQVVGRKDARAGDRLQALLDGADVCDRLSDPAGARARLERAILVDAPGLTEKAMFYLAEHIRGEDRARSLNLYYRAAAIAERNGGGFPYKAAMDRIVQFSMMSPP
jgi:hypothetical protein